MHGVDYQWIGEWLFFFYLYSFCFLYGTLVSSCSNTKAWQYDYEAYAKYSFCTVRCCGLQVEKPLSVVAGVFDGRPPLFWFQRPWKPPGLEIFWCNIMMNTVCPQVTLCKGLSQGYCNNGYTAHDFSKQKSHRVKYRYIRLASRPQWEAHQIVKTLAALSLCFSCNWRTCVCAHSARSRILLAIGWCSDWLRSQWLSPLTSVQALVGSEPNSFMNRFCE